MSAKSTAAFTVVLAALLATLFSGTISCSCDSDDEGGTSVTITGSDDCTEEKCASFLQFMDECGMTCLDPNDEPVSCTEYQDFCVACTEDWARLIPDCHPDTMEDMTCDEFSDCIVG